MSSNTKPEIPRLDIHTIATHSTKAPNDMASVYNYLALRNLKLHQNPQEEAKPEARPNAKENSEENVIEKLKRRYFN